MSVLAQNRFAVYGVVVALLAACSGAQPPTSSYDASATTPAFKHYQPFSYTGRKQSFKVPAGVTRLTITAYGANGGWGNVACCSGFSSSGGAGATVTATIPVTPGERLAIFVGGNGDRGAFNGGGDARRDTCGCGGGGGASDVRQGGDALAHRVLVAGGGGGGGINGFEQTTTSSGGTNDGGNGGYGGREGGTGQAGSFSLAGGGGAGGTQSAGGNGGAGGTDSSAGQCDGSPGSLGVGGAGGPGRANGCGAGGGGGGGGYYGGGGGGGGGSSKTSNGKSTDGAGGGGGGGSSFVESRARHVTMANGGNPTKHGDGSILVFW
jgi:hypothetical protein